MILNPKLSAIFMIKIASLDHIHIYFDDVNFCHYDAHRPAVKLRN